MQKVLGLGKKCEFVAMLTPALTSDSECVKCLAFTIVLLLWLEVWVTTAEVGPFGVVVMGRGQEGQTDHILMH